MPVKTEQNRSQIQLNFDLSMTKDDTETIDSTNEDKTPLRIGVAEVLGTNNIKQQRKGMQGQVHKQVKKDNSKLNQIIGVNKISIS